MNIHTYKQKFSGFYIKSHRQRVMLSNRKRPTIQPEINPKSIHGQGHLDKNKTQTEAESGTKAMDARLTFRNLNVCPSSQIQSKLSLKKKVLVTPQGVSS